MQTVVKSFMNIITVELWGNKNDRTDNKISLNRSSDYMQLMSGKKTDNLLVKPTSLDSNDD